MSRKILIILSNHYPFGNGEQYLENELDYMKDKFNKIFVIPNWPLKHNRNKNIETFTLINHKKRKVDLLFSFILFLKYISIRDIFKGISNIKTMLVSFHITRLKAKDFLQNISSEIEPNSTITFYSYWFYDFALLPILLKKRLPIRKMISRSHMNDGYQYLNKDFFLHTKTKHYQNILTISDDLRNHLLKYLSKSEQKKVSTLRLGTKSISEKDNLNFPSDNQEFLIVSCSSIEKRKRIDKIIDVLSNLDFKVRWVHFGDGNERPNIEKKIKHLNDNIKCELYGHRPNFEVHKFYLTNKINLFINLSITEGIPVSIMEAQAYGIPTIATNVYGVKEIVIPNLTGYLVDKELDIDSIKEKIINLRQNNFNSFKIKEFHKNHYNADLNYKKLISILIS